MPALTDPDRLAAYKDALRNWAVNGYILFDLTEQARRWVQRELGVNDKDIRRLMYEFVNGGGEIDEITETRPIWIDKWEFHHDLRFSLRGHSVYIETRLMFRLPFVPDDSRILVVNIHER